MKHYKYGGSVISRIAACPGSPKAIEELGDIDTSSDASREGTRLHSRVEQFLTPGGWEGKPQLKLDEEARAVEATKAVYEIIQRHGYGRDDIKCELQLQIKSIHPEECGGTLDIGAAAAFKDLLIIDLKFGYHPVEAEGNLQLAFYALALYEALSPFVRDTLNAVHLYIVQPEKSEPYNVNVRQWSISIADLTTIFAPFFKATVDNSEANPDMRVPGAHCEQKYCPARATCPAYREWIDESAKGALTAILSGEEPTVGCGGLLADQLKALPAVKAWCKAVEEQAKQMLLANPDYVPGWKLENGTGDRVWTDEKDFIKYAKAAGFKLNDLQPRATISPAAFDRLLKATNAKRKAANEEPIEIQVDKFVERPKTAAKLMPAETSESVADKFAAAMT